MVFEECPYCKEKARLFLYQNYEYICQECINHFEQENQLDDYYREECNKYYNEFE